jgi:flavin reductase (DIM6/NTAB) family NADH-FMN oxidoreductase RutF
MKEVALPHASRLINHGPTVLVTSRLNGRPNLMAAAWSMPVEFTPPRVAVVIDKATFTAEAVRATGQLALCIPGRALADITYAAGSVSGRDLFAQGLDKFQHLGLVPQPSPHFGLPLVAGCVAWLECRVLPEARTEAAYDTFFAEVIAAAADERVFAQGRWQLDTAPPELHTLHHLGGGRFAVASETLQAQPMAPSSPPPPPAHP